MMSANKSLHWIANKTPRPVKLADMRWRNHRLFEGSPISIEIILNIFFRELETVTSKIFLIEFIWFWKAWFYLNHSLSLNCLRSYLLRIVSVDVYNAELQGGAVFSRPPKSVVAHSPLYLYIFNNIPDSSFHIVQWFFKNIMNAE